MELWNGLRSRELTPYVNKAAAAGGYIYAEREDMHTRQGRDSIDVCAQAVCYYYISFMCRREVWFCLGSLEEKMAR
jgi:hypothetical protein